MGAPSLADRVVAEQLKNYAKGHVDSVKNEYTNQALKWKLYVNNLADCQIKALKNQQDKLKKTRTENQVFVQLAMIALSFVGGGAVGWLSNAVEKKLFPKFAGTLGDAFQNGSYTFKRSYNEVAAKYWGDSVNKVVGNAVDTAIGKLMPPDIERNPNGGLEGALLGDSLITFKTQLDNAMTQEMQLSSNALALLGANINQSESFGYALLEQVDKMYPKSPRESDSARAQIRERAGKQLLNEYFDKLRMKYAGSWFYYANNPDTVRSLSSIVLKLEVQIWKLWVLDQKFEIRTTPDPIISENRRAQGKDGWELNEGLLQYFYDDLGETSLYDLYYKIYRQLLSTSIESNEDLNIVKVWAKKQPVWPLNFLPRKLPSITDPDAIFKER